MQAILTQLIAALLMFGAGTAAQAKWLRADTPNFILYSDGNEKTLREYATVLEDFDGLLRLVVGLKAPPSPNRLTIYLVRSADQMQRYRKLPDNTLGVYISGASGIAAYAVRASTGVGLNGQTVLLHEYAHHFMLQYFPHGYPAWYVEGFAEYMSTAKFKPDVIEWGLYDQNRAAWLISGNWLSAEAILDRAPNAPRLTGDRNAMFYAQSWMMVHYFYRDPTRSKQFRKYLADIVTGRKPAEAFEAAFQIPYSKLNALLRNYIERRLSYTKMGRPSDRMPVSVTVTALPASADSLLLEQAALRVAVHDKYATQLLAAVRRAAAQHPGDALAARVAANAEVQLGDRDAGVAMLDTLLAGEGRGDAELLYLRGVAELRAERPIKARPFFARAHKIDPNHYQSLFRYGQTFAADGQKPSDNSINILMLAHELAPQVGEIAVTAAAMLMQRERYGEARALLQPVVLNPHGDDGRDAAQAMFDAATQAMAVAPVTASK